MQNLCIKIYNFENKLYLKYLTFVIKTLIKFKKDKIVFYEFYGNRIMLVFNKILNTIYKYYLKPRLGLGLSLGLPYYE